MTMERRPGAIRAFLVGHTPGPGYEPTQGAGGSCVIDSAGVMKSGTTFFSQLRPPCIRHARLPAQREHPWLEAFHGDLLAYDVGVCAVELRDFAPWASAAATTLAAIVALFIALFKEPIQAFIFRPRFKVAIETRSPYCLKTKGTVGTVYANVVPTGERHVLWQGSFYYARLWVQNTGRTRAEGVEVFVTKVEQKLLDGSYKTHDGFIPANLRWANTNPEVPEIRTSMSREMGRHCDLGAIADPQCTTLNALHNVPKGQATFDLVLEYPLPGVDWSPFLRQTVKTQFLLNGELSHGTVTQAVHAGV
jgi:hypothetical protein